MQTDPAVGTKLKAGETVTLIINRPAQTAEDPDGADNNATPQEPGSQPSAGDKTWSCNQTLSAPEQYKGGIAKIELIQETGDGDEKSITIMDGQAISSWPYAVNTTWDAPAGSSSTGRIIFYEMDGNGEYQAIAQYPQVPLS